MINQSIFKAYDVRGKYPGELSKEATFKISQALGEYFGSGAKIIIGHDARLSSPTLYKEVLSGVRSRVPDIGCIEAGMITTPMLYFLVNKLKADGGIMITASHNPKEYNGLKVVGKNAKPMSGKDILKIMNNE